MDAQTNACMTNVSYTPLSLCETFDTGMQELPEAASNKWEVRETQTLTMTIKHCPIYIARLRDILKSSMKGVHVYMY